MGRTAVEDKDRFVKLNITLFPQTVQQVDERSASNRSLVIDRDLIRFYSFIEDQQAEMANLFTEREIDSIKECLSSIHPSSFRTLTVSNLRTLVKDIVSKKASNKIANKLNQASDGILLALADYCGV